MVILYDEARGWLIPANKRRPITGGSAGVTDGDGEPEESPVDQEPASVDENKAPTTVRRKKQVQVVYPLPKVIEGKFELKKYLGGGTFGRVFSGECLHSNKPVAVKIEVYTTKTASTIYHECEMYSLASEGNNAFTKVYWSGTVKDIHQGMVMELHGSTLHTLLKEFKTFSPKTVMMLGIQLVEKLGIIHRKNIIHLDVKPLNLVMGIGARANEVFLIDFGLAINKNEMEEEQPSKFCGTLKYASIGVHKGLERSFRDDLESLGYTLIQLLKGSLPWEAAKKKPRSQRFPLVESMKEEIDPDTLCEGLPACFRDYMQYCRNLQVDEFPNYDYLKFLFTDMLTEQGLQFDHVYDWDSENSQI